MRLSASILAMLLAGCSTIPVQPAISDFTSAVQATTAAAEKRYREENVAALLAAETDEAVVEAGAFYDLINCDGPIGLSVDLNDPALSDFGQHCSYETFLPGEGGVENRPVEVEDGQPGLTGDQAVRIARKLSAYASALNTLATSDKPAELEKDFSTAASAVLDMFDEAKKIKTDGEGLAQPDRELANAASGLGSSLLRGYFETRRFRLLLALIEQSDPAVQVSARAIAGWYRSQTSAQILGAYQRLEVAKAAQQRATMAHRNGDGTKEAALEATREFRTAYEELARLETNAPWRTHLAIAEAHSAMLEATRSPYDLDALAYANGRIDDLVSKTIVFVDAVEASDDGDQQ